MKHDIDSALKELDKLELFFKSLRRPKFFDVNNYASNSIWPRAVPNEAVAESSGQEYERAANILHQWLPGVDLSGKVLDFGCGQGHLAELISKNAELCVGYDLWQTGDLTWKSAGKCLLTTDFAHVRENGPYDIVLCYDVLDHAEESTPVELLLQIHGVCRPGTRIIVRCHPWISRHGGHVYKNLNLAFAHLVFTQEELESAGYRPPQVQKVIYPIKTYREWFTEAGFGIASLNPVRDVVEKFFYGNNVIPDMPERIKIITGHDGFPEFQMSLSFVDCVLSVEQSV